MLKKIEGRREEVHQHYVDKQEREKRGTVVDHSPTDFTMMPLSSLVETREDASFPLRHGYSTHHPYTPTTEEYIVNNAGKVKCILLKVRVVRTVWYKKIEYQAIILICLSRAHHNKLKSITVYRL
jgi:hypothetical protein